MENDLSFLMLVFGSLFLIIEIFFFHSLSDTHSVVSYVFGVIILASYECYDHSKEDEKAGQYENHLHNIRRLDGIRNVERQVDQGS